MEDGHVSKVMSRLSHITHRCPTIIPPFLFSSFRCFIELIFGGGWCILGETALEKSLQSNKLADKKQ